MSYALAEIATELGCDERTLRRYADLGLLRAEKRGGCGETRLPYREERFLKRQWDLLSGLRRGLRTEHRVRLAVLFGSIATGEDRPDSDVDLLIGHSTGDPEQLVALRRRLQKRIDRPVHLVLLDDAERSAVLMADVLTEGRVIVDRDEIWSDLEDRRERALREAGKEADATRAAAREAVAAARERLSV
jgi:predicted nucleotidyltransferase